MKAYVAPPGGRWFAVLYEGLDPGHGREHRSRHAAGYGARSSATH